MTDLDVHAHAAEAAWQNYYALRQPFAAQCMAIVAELEPTTGLQPHPGAIKLIDVLIDLAIDQYDEICEMYEQRARARRAEDARDALTPVLPAPPDATPLDQLVANGGEEAVREWLKTVTAADLGVALAAENDEDRGLWAAEMLTAARADGATHAIIEVLEYHLAQSQVGADATMAPFDVSTKE